MTDTAEYWWDVKSRSNRFPNDFFHAKGLDCGHRHNIETPYLGDVTCYACLDKLKQSTPDNMREGKAPETYYLSAKDKKRFNQRKRFNELHGICPCGFDWSIRTNKKNGTQFLGCSNYPKCKNTKSFSPII